MINTKMKPETIKRRRLQRAAADRRQHKGLSERILLKYHLEIDREYAEDMWGSMLRERGIYYEDRGRK